MYLTTNAYDSYKIIYQYYQQNLAGILKKMNLMIMKNIFY